MCREQYWNDTDRGGNRSTQKINFHVTAILSTTNLKWAGLGLNLGLRSDGRGTKVLTQGTALSLSYDIPSSSP